MKKPRRLRAGDLVGFAAPCYKLDREKAEAAAAKFSELGFRVKFSEHLFDTDDGYAASLEKRVEDFNALARDPEVRMILFGGGEVGNELLPYIDYEALAKDPKILSSYSDGTTILEAVTSQSGIVTYYGQSPRSFMNGTDFNMAHFKAAVLDGAPYVFPKESEWVTIREGSCEGVLTGGYLINFAVMLNGKYYKMPDEDCILFVEDMIGFSEPAAVSKWFSHIEQSGLFKKVKGLLWGYYDAVPQPLIDDILKRIGDKYDIPVVRCEDYGHCIRSGLIPIGVHAKLDASAKTLTVTESTVEEE